MLGPLRAGTVGPHLPQAGKTQEAWLTESLSLLLDQQLAVFAVPFLPSLLPNVGRISTIVLGEEGSSGKWKVSRWSLGHAGTPF